MLEKTRLVMIETGTLLELKDDGSYLFKGKEVTGFTCAGWMRNEVTGKIAEIY